MCGCINQINKTLIAQNNKIFIPPGGPEIPSLRTEKVDVTSKMPRRRQLVFASHCPFCGQRYEPGK